MTTLSQVLQAIPHFNAEQLSEIEKRIKMARTMKGDHTEPAETGKGEIDETIVLDALIEMLKVRGYEYTNQVMLRRTPQFRSFREKVPLVMRFLHRSGITNRNQIRALLTTAFQLLYIDLTQMGVPVDARMIMNHVHRLPAVVNHSFPGYAMSRVLPKLVN